MLIPFRKSLCVLLAAATPVWGTPGRLLAAAPATTGATAADTAESGAELDAIPVRLSAEGRMQGTVKTADGQPAAGVPVVIGVNGKPVGRTLADDQGRFEFGPLKEGRYQLATKEAVAMVDLYNASDAPVKAEQTIEVSRPAMIARGQSPRRWLTHPVFLGLVIAAAIAIPLALTLDDDDDDDDDAS